MTRPGIEPATSRSQSGRSTTEPLCRSSKYLTWVLKAVRQEVNNLKSSVMVQKLELAINLALYVFFFFFFFMKLRFLNRKPQGYMAAVPKTTLLPKSLYRPWCRSFPVSVY